MNEIHCENLSMLTNITNVCITQISFVLDMNLHTTPLAHTQLHFQHLRSFQSNNERGHVVWALITAVVRFIFHPGEIMGLLSLY